MMSSSPAIQNDKAKPDERRALPRETLNHYVVLAFFGEDNWGKLTNMSESGMAFEFSRPPSLHERINFTFQVMGCMPMPRDKGGLGESFEATGEIKWVRDFERGAGVQFVKLAENNREQIRQWLSFEASMNPASGREGKTEVPAVLTELLAPLAPPTESASAAEADKATEADKSLPELDGPEALPEMVQEPMFQEPEEIRHEPSLDNGIALAEKQWEPEFLPRPQASVARLTFLVVSGCLAAFAVTAGVRIIMTREARRAETVGSAPARHLGKGEPATAVHSSADVPAVVSSALPSPVSSQASPLSAADASAEAAPPFQVEVTDANGKSWMLWFVRSGSKDEAGQASSNNSPPSRSLTSATRGIKQEQAASAGKSVPRTFTMETPSFGRPVSNGSSSGDLPVEAPAIPPELASPARDPIGGINTKGPAPPPAEKPVGGMVQVAHLVQATLPIYPEIAKSSRVSGDVLVDALIDTNGKVTSAKAISGPALLQEAAMETVKHWKYEPARLDGQAVAMHLTVTVRFRIN